MTLWLYGWGVILVEKSRTLEYNVFWSIVVYEG